MGAAMPPGMPGGMPYGMAPGMVPGMAPGMAPPGMPVAPPRSMMGPPLPQQGVPRGVPQGVPTAAAEQGPASADALTRPMEGMSLGPAQGMAHSYVALSPNVFAGYGGPPTALGMAPMGAPPMMHPAMMHGVPVGGPVQMAPYPPGINAATRTLVFPPALD